MKWPLPLFLIIISLTSYSQTQLDMSMDASTRLKKANIELDSVYAEILKEYKSDTVFLKTLKTSQETWTEFRDAELMLRYPHKGPAFYGSVKPMCETFYLISLTVARTETLRIWLDGIEEGDVCRGSVRMK